MLVLLARVGRGPSCEPITLEHRDCLGGLVQRANLINAPYRSLNEKCLDRLIPMGSGISCEPVIRITNCVRRRARLGGLLNVYERQRDRQVAREMEHYGRKLLHASSELLKLL